MTNIDEWALHVPVFGKEVCDWLVSEHPITILDCSVGYGGHAELLLTSSPAGTKVIGLDRDAQAIEYSRQRLIRFGDHVVLRQGNHRDLKRYLADVGVATVDRVLFDFGISSPQLNDAMRGFSFQVDGPLDMRMDQSTGKTAADLVNGGEEHELADIIFQYGEERYARRIARTIVQERQRHRIETTGQLVSVVVRSVPAAHRHGRIHCATRTFQALRIAVNQELVSLEPSLRDAVEVLSGGGRICAISFHSLEDRVVKHTFKSLAQRPDPTLALLTKKPILPSGEECESNPRSRSAKLRVAERQPRLELS
ncbi:MAG: 16S rRNA (cytosine(1402)-N(4))-methyltransferase RsmH [Nitrospira sp.]|nr:16S rRNA (cytosine(1402)-N(4))-methyltransferase RsmH [Nitrospira sp.]MDH4369981.1 16S rRNA (cytosine(1402)-N(4))-methyltransferase RsmH [Nitrospira sp.]MDH5347530.1 16S rRNA (cytosine(1402)-N(4))-methyltransferase RsmH [Nitrospira sp.]MDH5498860.1 16S rRNA (cytosine(1402)-N(4))-methyltransferase RsmH [Nitrospira sp.]MDH5725229.1 16S rRNA (cytosine(1402)-N(4))-methyltransferase RsmH [Nitrospira sp.]